MTGLPSSICISIGRMSMNHALESGYPNILVDDLGSYSSTWLTLSTNQQKGTREGFEHCPLAPWIFSDFTCGSTRRPSRAFIEFGYGVGQNCGWVFTSKQRANMCFSPRNVARSQVLPHHFCCTEPKPRRLRRLQLNELASQVWEIHGFLLEMIYT